MAEQRRVTSSGALRAVWDGDQNPFDLPKPPRWVLEAMHAYDPELVIMPGLTDRCYRVQRYHPEARKLRPFTTNSETQRMADKSVMPVVSLQPNANWHQLLPWLKTHDLWQYPDADAIADKLEADEATDRAKIDAQVRDGCEQRAISSWFSYQVRTGQLVFVQGAPVPHSADGQPSAPHRGPGLNGDLDNASLPDQLGAGDASVPLGVAQGENAAVSEAAVLVSGTAQGQS